MAEVKRNQSELKKGILQTASGPTNNVVIQKNGIIRIKNMRTKYKRKKQI